MKKHIKSTIITCLFGAIFSIMSIADVKAQTPIRFSFENKSVTEKYTFLLTINVDSLLTGKGIYAYKLGITYYANNLEYLGIDSVGAPLKSWGLPTVNSKSAGVLYIAQAGTQALTGKGGFLYLKFRAKASGYCYFDNIPSFSSFNEGSPSVLLNYNYVYIAPIPFPDIYPDSREMFVGENFQLYANGGTAPYTFGSANAAIATVDASGIVTAKAPGATKIFTTDAKGNVNYMSGVVDVRAIKFRVMNSGTSLLDTFYLPIKIEIAPGTKVYSGSFELSFNGNLEGIKSNFQTGDYNVTIQNNASTNIIRVSFASATGLTGTGILCKLAMRAVNSGTHYIYLQNVNCNEDLRAFVYEGTVGVECKPCTKVTGLLPANGEGNQNSTMDLYWQPSLNVRNYQVFLWEDGTAMPSSPYQNVYGTSARLYNLKPGITYHWKIVSVNECSQIESDIQSFTTKLLPDLVVTNVQVPKEIQSGSEFTVNFTVKNIGQTATVATLWQDMVYISTDSAYYGGKTQLMAKYNPGQLAVNETYTQAYTMTMPTEYKGKYYIFVVTDVYNALTELSDNNNQRRFADSIKVALKPFPDIKVKDIQPVGTSLIPGDSLLVNWKVENIGNADALGGWSERITLVSSTGFRVTLNPMVSSNTDLSVGQTRNRSYKFKIPEVLHFSGTANVEVELYPSASLIEYSGTTANNKALSVNTVTAVDFLFLDIAASVLSEGSTSEVRCVITRSGDYTSPLQVNISHSPSGQITVPTTVTIPANLSSEIFNLRAVDNSLVDGARNVRIIASASAYRNDTSSIQILDNEATVLKAVLNKTLAKEGDSLKLRITRNLVTNTPLLVYLSADKSSQLHFVNAATIPANDSVVVVTLYAINDKSPELTDVVTLTISSGGFVSGNVTATITDDDMPELEFTLSRDTVSEVSGVYATYGSIKRKTGEGNITVNFTASVDSALILPGSITIPNGTNEVKFNIGVVDNGEVDGYRKVIIIGSIFVKSCSCNTTPDNGGVISKALVIADNDGPALTASVNPVSMFEGRVNAGKLIITRNTSTTNSLTVAISHNDPSEVIIPTTAVIPAGQKSVQIPITTINDGIEDGNQMVSITVQTAGFISGFCFMYVTDLNKPDFILRNIEVSKSKAITKEAIQVTGKLVNVGYLNAPMGSKVGLYLSKDDYLDETNDQLLGTFQTTAQILMGDSLPFTESITMPVKTGIYKLLVHANPNNVVNELVYTNNTADPISITVQPEYTVTAKVDLTQSLPNIPITIYGKATLVNLQPATNVNVDIYLLCNGTRKELTATTNALGNYQVVFTPLPDESGHFEVGACYPDEDLNDVQDSFDILGLKRTSNDYIIWLTKIGDTLNGTLQIKNTSNIELKNVQMKVVQLPDGCTLTANPIAVLAGNATIDIPYTVKGTIRSKTTDYQKLKFALTTDEGVNIMYDAYYFCQEQEALLETNPTSINTTVSKGSTKYFEFTLTNKGAGETGKVRILLPNVNFLTLVSADSLANIKSGESVSVTLKLTDDDLALNTPVNGTIALNCEHGKGIVLPYKLEAVSDAKGGLKIDVLDEFTYNTKEAPHVKDAHIVVRHPFSGVIAAEGFSNSEGIFEATNIAEGYYTMTVEAEKHEGYRNNLIIDAGKTLTQNIFLSFQAITYTWEVVRTEIEDEYKVDLIMKFETNVPAPVVIMVMPDTMPHLINDETFPFMVTLTNKGLITALDVALTLPEDPEYEFITNFTKMDLLAQQSIQIPVVMRRKAGYSPVGGMQRSAMSDLACFNVVVEGHAFYCGPDRKWHTGAKLFSFAGRVCIGSPGGYNPGGGGYGPSLGGPGGGYVYIVPTNNNSTVSINDIVECDNCLMDIGLAALGCFPFTSWIPGAVSNTVGCLKSASDGEMSAWDWFTCLGGYITTTVKKMSIGCIIGVVGAARTCFIDEPFWKSPTSRPSNVIAQGNAPKPLMPPIIKQATNDLLSVMDAADARRNWIDEFIGNKKLFDRVNFADFIHEIDSFTIYKKKIQPLDIIKINQKLYGTDILAEEVEAFTLRWNSTLDAWAKNILVPDTEFPDIINDNLLKLYAAQEDSTIQYAINRGYEGIDQMAELAYNTIKDETNTGKKSVCASITLKISQKVTMTREAFEGTLTITNGNTQIAMTKIKLNLEVKNSQGILCNDLFQINTKALSVLTGIDGTGELGADKKGSASILFIPEKSAAPQVPTSYSFGGSFSYVDPFNGLEVTKQLFPITLDVNPSPDLFLHYFMQRDILGDDPLTPAIEPIVPGELALMIQNNGFGTATKVRVESAQPEIIENQKGLAIHLALIGSNLNGQTRQLGLTNIDFGNIVPKTSTIGQWWFTSDLLGHFVNYETHVVHSNSFGNPDLSLVSGAKLHELIRSIRVYNADDGINDFLVNEIQDANETPDEIYTSNGVVLPVTTVNSISTNGVLSAPGYEIELNVTPKLYGWNYGKITDPTNGRYKILSVTRQSDGKVLPLDNVWQTHITLPDGFEPIYEHKIHFVDDFSAVQPTRYIIKFVPNQIDPPVILRIENVPTAVITTRLSSVRVVFDKSIDITTFDYADMTLRVQGGDNLMNNTVKVTKVNETTFDVDISTVTLADGYYVLTIQTTNITNLMGETGELSKQVSWSQFTNTPAIQEFIGIPIDAVSTSFDNIMLRFTVPINTSTFTTERLIWTRNGSVVSGAITITPMDAEGKLFKILGLNTIMTNDAEYGLTVDLLQIRSKTGVNGMINQSVKWRIDTKPPTISKFKLKNDGGYDNQHVTAVELTFSEPVVGFDLSVLELWKEALAPQLQPRKIPIQQPISQLNFTKVNDSTYLITDFRLLTYYEGIYTLKINMANITDPTNNPGLSKVIKTWTVNRTAPAAITEMKISPDFGFSAVDGITSTSQVAVSMRVNAPDARVRLYYNSFGTSSLLVDTLPTTTGLLTLPVSIPSAGSMSLEAECIDTLGNKSLTDLPIYIDDMPLSATWNSVPSGVLRKNPVSVVLDLSEKLQNETILKDNLTCQLNGDIVAINTLSITKYSNTQFNIGGFGNKGVDAGGTFSLSLNTANLNKHLSGRAGSLTYSTQWSLRGNNAPVANAGMDKSTVAIGDLVVLDGSKSEDADNDQLTYYWTTPSGITLNNINAVKPTFIAPNLGADKLTFSLVVNDGVTDSPADDVVINLVNTKLNTVKESINNISISPNPTYNEFMLDVNEPNSGTLNIRIYNNIGQLVHIENRTHSPAISMYKFNNLKLIPGLYLVDVRMNNAKTVGLIKLIVIDK